MNAQIALLVLFEQGGPGDDQPVRSTLALRLEDLGAVVDRFRVFAP